MSVVLSSYYFIDPPFATLLPHITSFEMETHELLHILGKRLGMYLQGGDVDLQRISVWFVNWWRKQGGNKNSKYRAPSSETARGWGFDFDWSDDRSLLNIGATLHRDKITNLMENQIRRFHDQLNEEARIGAMVSDNQLKKRLKKEKLRRKEERRVRLSF